MAVRVAINGFGRIGRNVLRAIAESGRTDIEVVGINDLGPVETNAHLLRFDAYGDSALLGRLIACASFQIRRAPRSMTGLLYSLGAILSL